MLGHPRCPQPLDPGFQAIHFQEVSDSYDPHNASVPLATYTGWNLFNARRGPTHALSSFDGCYIPFPRTEAERAAKGDPRPSIESRYRNRDEYLGRITQATLKLVSQGYLLTEDMAGVVERAAQQWDYVMGTSSP